MNLFGPKNQSGFFVNYAKRKLHKFVDMCLLMERINERAENVLPRHNSDCRSRNIQSLSTLRFLVVRSPL